MRRQPDRTSQTFLDLHDRLGRRLLAYLARRTLDTDTAAELWSETWAIAFESWHRCKATSDAEAEAWVFGIARNQTAAYYRTGSIQRRAMERLRWTVPPTGGALDEELDRIIDRESLRGVMAEALDSLPPMRRRAVHLRIIDGLDYRDVAERLECSEQAARAHVSRGLKRLTEHLDGHELQCAIG